MQPHIYFGSLEGIVFHKFYEKSLFYLKLWVTEVHTIGRKHGLMFQFVANSIHCSSQVYLNLGYVLICIYFCFEILKFMKDKERENSWRASEHRRMSPSRGYKDGLHSEATSKHDLPLETVIV